MLSWQFFRTGERFLFRALQGRITWPLRAFPMNDPLLGGTLQPLRRTAAAGLSDAGPSSSVNLGAL